MSGIEPTMKLEQGDCLARVTMEYGPDAMDTMALRAAERIEDDLVQQILSRLGYVKPVRCGECEHSTIDTTDHEHRDALWCSLFRIDTTPNKFCSWGCRQVAQ